MKAREHIVDSQFKSDKYAWSPPGFVPLKLTDQMAQDLLLEYANRRRAVDEAFADDLVFALGTLGVTSDTAKVLLESEIIDRCEGCSKALYEGDLAHTYDDGPSLCEPCAPTFASLKVQYDKDAASGALPEICGSSEAASAALALVTAKVDAGEGHLKHVWPI